MAVVDVLVNLSFLAASLCPRDFQVLHDVLVPNVGHVFAQHGRHAVMEIKNELRECGSIFHEFGGGQSGRGVW